MNTLSISHAALDMAARTPGAARPVSGEPRLEPVAATRAAIERQIDEIQHTFSVRWEW